MWIILNEMSIEFWVFQQLLTIEETLFELKLRTCSEDYSILILRFLTRDLGLVGECSWCSLPGNGISLSHLSFLGVLYFKDFKSWKWRGLKFESKKWHQRNFPFRFSVQIWEVMMNCIEHKMSSLNLVWKWPRKLNEKWIWDNSTYSRASPKELLN